MSAQTILAILLARATVTSMRGLRASMPISHGLARDLSRAATLAAELAPRISSRRKLRSPIFEVRPSRSFPPLECCFGVRPSQAAKSRPRRKVDAGGASATRAVATTGPIPGMVIRRLAAGSALARVAISRSSTTIFACTDCRLSAITTRTERASSGSSDPGSATRSMSLFTWPLPHDEAELSEVTAQRIDQLGPLADQQVACAEDHSSALCFRALRPDEPHRRTLRRLADRLRIGHVVLLPLHERLHIDWRNEPGLVPQRGDLASPVMSAGASLHGHQASWLPSKERQQLPPPELLTKDHGP